MPTFKAVRILSKFHNDDWKRFEVYCDLNAEPLVFSLFTSLKKNRKKLPLSKEDIQTKMPEFEKGINSLMSDLLKHINNYICYDYPTLHSDIFRAEKILGFYSDRNLPYEYQSYLRKEGRKIVNRQPISALDHLALYEFYKTLVIHETLLNGRNLTISLSDYEIYLDSYYWLEKLKLSCEHLNRYRVIDSENTLNDTRLTELLTLTEGMAAPDSFIEVYRHILLLLSERIPLTIDSIRSLFERLKKLDFSTTNRAETLTLSHYLINFSIKGAKTDLRYGVILNDLILFMEDKDILLERSNFCTCFQSCNICRFNLGRVTSAKSFFEKYKYHLPMHAKTAVTQYTEALITLYDKNNDLYKRALWKVKMIDDSDLDIYFKLNIKSLEMMLSFENSICEKTINEDIEELDKLVIAFVAITKAGKGLSEVKRQSFINFAELAQKLFHGWGSKIETQKIYDSIATEPLLHERFWLLSMAKKRQGNITLP